jgi:hypothetical protein
MNNSHFYASSSFKNGNFWGKGNSFISTIFEGKVNFEDTRFTHSAPATRISKTRFERCDFYEEVDFIYTHFPRLKQRIITLSNDPNSKEDYQNEDSFRVFLNDLLDINLKGDDVKQYIEIDEKLNEIKVYPDDPDIYTIRLSLSLLDKAIKHPIFPKSCIKGILFVTHHSKKDYAKDLKFVLEKSNNKKQLYFINDFLVNPNDIPLGFEYSTFRKRVRFIGLPDNPISLTGISFKGLDLSNFEFHNVEWIEKGEIFKQRMIIIDELFDRRTGNYEEISKIYNQLRKNYESKLLFNEASNFFIGEMEAIRKSKWYSNKSISKLNVIQYLLYKYLALYGESIKLPLLIWMPIIISVIALSRNDWNINFALLDHIKRSFFNFFPIPTSVTNQLGDVFVLEKILSLPILGLTFIALLRRFERTK